MRVESSCSREASSWPTERPRNCERSTYRSRSWSSHRAEPERLRDLSLPGVSSLEIEGNRVRIVTANADETMRALYRSDVDVHDVSAKESDLDEVFLKLAQSQEPV